MSSDSSNPFVKLTLFFFDFFPWWLWVGGFFIALIGVAFDQEQKKKQADAEANEPTIDETKAS